ncbi:predicted protein [Ostreococcus lucimarinus CCE9901]|uniref:Uncharacterized protein n=1 Tax=Ostreococcus lucimarinus (strain CCE9901) TaxID=436017 RepID=A4S7K5_OSTLU|nr:predicted protein [Ostreococcus lucimarinus CCE9901]ABO99762.1 predicted protein [Ostreococcus lucimarinus CCE9901]|eukprot:XP_001421469.1 predicted protein [Ostreococcus lucimarinus CCE9901]
MEGISASALSLQRPRKLANTQQSLLLVRFTGTPTGRRSGNADRSSGARARAEGGGGL